MVKTELLAPAKDKYTAFSAIDCGADAVYIGASSFGARRNAQNSLEDIQEVIQYAHKFWVKVFVTVNTILTDNELDEAVELVKILDKMNVDAILVQDMGLLNRIIELQNNNEITIPIHMSTQCDNRDSEKVSFFNKLGVSRVVLARELSLKQIEVIHKENPEIELEAFVHGALCVSYSGQCYLSEHIGGRSANRGECAQPCRKKYTVVDDKGKIVAKDIYALCLKDFNASEHIEQMINSGVFSFKIEGRLKEPSYVKNIVAFYRRELDKYSTKTSSGKSIYSFSPNPYKTFNRGFTDYFLDKRNNCFSFESPKSKGEYLGVVKKIFKDSFTLKLEKSINSIHSQDGLCYFNDNKLEGFLVNKVDENGKIYPNKNFNLKVGDVVYRNIDSEFEKELAKPVKRQIGIFVEIDNCNVKIKDEDGIVLNYKITSNESAKNQQRMNDLFVQQFSKTGESDFYIEDIKIKSNIPFMKVSEINHIRRDAFDMLMLKRLQNYKREKQNKLSYSEYYIESVDYRANVHNKEAKKFYANCNCKVEEMSYESCKPNRQIELMRTKHCIKYALGICKSPVKLLLQDEKGIKYPLKFDCSKCEMAIMNI